MYKRDRATKRRLTRNMVYYANVIIPITVGPAIQDFPKSHEEFEKYRYIYAQIGRAVVAWGRLEYSFSQLLQMLYDLHNTQEISPQPPVSFKQKSKFWRDCFKNITRLSEHYDSAVSFATAFTKEARARNILLHYSWRIIKPEEFGIEILGEAVTYGKNGYTIDRYHLPINEIELFIERLEKLEVRMLGFYVVILTSLTNSR